MFMQNNRSDHDSASSVGDEELKDLNMETDDNSPDDQTDDETKKQAEDQSVPTESRQRETVTS